MVSRDEMRRMAWSYDTTVSRAFRRALGGKAPRDGRRRATVAHDQRHDPRFRGVRACMRDTASPMDCRGLR